MGGSGFYEFLEEDAEEVKLDTPFGTPSDPVLLGEVAGRQVAFLPRHGRDHRFPPHRIPYRANMWALRSLGVRRVLAPTAVGSLTPAYGLGTLVVPDQLVDRTRTREVDLLRRGRLPRAVRRPTYCPSVRPVAIATAREQGWEPASSWDAGRHRGAEVLQPRRVAVVRRPGLDPGRDDRPPRGGP